MELINNVVMVSGEQQRDSVIHTHISILPQTPLQSGMPHNIEQSSLCGTVEHHLFELVFSFSSGLYSALELLDHLAVLFKESPYCFL